MKSLIVTIIIATVSLVISGCKCACPSAGTSSGKGAQNIKVVLKSDVEWTHLNPKRGDLAPKAGTLWGDRNGTEPTGFLLKPPKNFESPPHIHNVSYRGVVIQGIFHNDDPDAGEMWMPSGSFWTQPKGHVHITAADGIESLAYIEIEKGPYLVLPSKDKFDTQERPVNVDESNLVWLNASDITWVDQPGAQMAFLWGTPKTGELNGTFIKLKAGFKGTINSNGSSFRAVVIQGQLQHGAAAGKTLDPGSGFSSEGESSHQLSTKTGSIIYVRTNGKYEVIN